MNKEKITEQNMNTQTNEQEDDNWEPYPLWKALKKSPKVKPKRKKRKSLHFCFLKGHTIQMETVFFSLLRTLAQNISGVKEVLSTKETWQKHEPFFGEFSVINFTLLFYKKLFLFFLCAHTARFQSKLVWLQVWRKHGKSAKTKKQW